MFAVRSGYWQSLLAPAGWLDVHAEPHVCDLHCGSDGGLSDRSCGGHVGSGKPEKIMCLFLSFINQDVKMKVAVVVYNTIFYIPG